jgi:pimeloyl-ACP methyl ester carboxylesterase
VSPALKVKQTVEQVTNSQPSSIRIFFGAGIAALRRVILDPVIMYILRRAVGRPGFWKKGLKLAWGNPSLLSDTDAMRFQWPSIGLGWESGLLSFTRSRIASTCPYHGGEVKLLSDVLNMPLTKVVIIQGIDDPIVPLSMTKKIVDHFEDRISFIPLPGQGHDPFEEEVEEFVDCVVHEIQKS